jgi:SpoVK/Ycf46/Vps4 family AAA+-type ATPase
MEIQSICDDIVGQKVIFIPFDPKKEFRYLLISIGQEQHICNLLYTKRIETGCIVSNSVLGAASTGTLVEFILFFNEADILPLELIEFEIEASFELFRILEKRKDLILFKLCDLFISNQKITINFMQKQISLKANLDKIGKITNETKISLIKIEKLSTIETFKMKSVEKASKNIKNQLNIFKKISKTKAIILHGAKGVGKTSLAMKIAKSQTHKYIKASSLISEKLGKTEQNLVDLFMTKNKILVIDDIEELLNPLLSQLLLELLKDQSICLLVIAITSRLDLIDPILISSAGFSNLHQLTLPQFSDRITLLKDLLAYEGSKSNIQSLSGLLETKDECLDSNIAVARQIEHISDESNNIEDLELFKQIAIETQGFSCSDMVNILQSTIPNELTLKNILTTSKITKPANLHGIQSQIPSITFKDLYGIDKITSKLKVL